MIERNIGKDVTKTLARGKAAIIIGARQIGKSTLLEHLFAGRNDVLWLNGDDFDVRQMFENITSTRLRAIIGDNKVVVIDEAQRIADAGLKLKLITDQMKDVQLVATGSSSFQLTSMINESLAGRKRELRMFPLSFGEMVAHTNFLEEMRMLPHRMIYGYYPEVVTHIGEERDILKELVDSYLYKDVLELDSIKKSDKIMRLLQSLSLQIGSQVSYNEIGQMVGLDSKTVEKYIDILEKCFVIFRLPSYARNMRNELKASRKVFFYDMGIRNAVIGNYTPLELRNPSEIGEMWENFVIAERLKRNVMSGSNAKMYFWRTQQQSEIDLIEDNMGRLDAFEFKWNPKAKARNPKPFLDAYEGSTFNVISPSNIEVFVG
ncbi:MAG: ATP-binding protein [Bacteroidales bacterium]|nr:ATP-binding protein [Bacteroidales bacterium]